MFVRRVRLQDRARSYGRLSSIANRTVAVLRTGALAGVVLALIGLGSAGGCTEQGNSPDSSPPPPSATHAEIVALTPEEVSQVGIAAKPVQRGQFRTRRDFPGTIQPNENARAEITALVRGRVVDVYADVGREVKTGTLLARLYSSEARLAQSTYLKAMARLHETELAFDRARDLQKAKAISLAELQKREAEVKGTRAEAREARGRLELLGMQERDVQRLEREHTVHPYVPIRSPFAGRVIARNVTRGEVVEIEETLFVVADLSTVWVIANIPEKDIPYINQFGNAGRAVDVLVSAYPQEPFHGRVAHVGDVLDPSTRTLRIRVEVDNPDGRLKPEMFVAVRVESDPDPRALTVPAVAIQRDRDESIVFVQLDDRRFLRRTVKIAEEHEGTVRVLDGLQEGERVVAYGSFVLKTELVNQRQNRSNQ